MLLALTKNDLSLYVATMPSSWLTRPCQVAKHCNGASKTIVAFRHVGAEQWRAPERAQPVHSVALDLLAVGLRLLGMVSLPWSVECQAHCCIQTLRLGIPFGLR